MTKNLPSKRYDLFIKVFEQKVTAVQKEIEALRGMEQLYNLVKEALESIKLPNEQHINIHSRSLFAHYRATPMDRLATFEPAVKAIGDRLHKAGLHGGEPAVEMGGSNCDVDYRWYIRGRSIWLTVDVPEKGMVDLAVDVVTRTTEERQYVMARLEPPTYAAPSNLKTVGEREAGLVAALDPEVPF